MTFLWEYTLSDPLNCTDSLLHTTTYLRLTATDVQQDLRNRVMDELNDLADMDGFAASNDYVFPAISYHFTSIYQSSIYEALSKVLSRLMPCQGALERLLDILSTVGSTSTTCVSSFCGRFI